MLHCFKIRFAKKGLENEFILSLLFMEHVIVSSNKIVLLLAQFIFCLVWNISKNLLYIQLALMSISFEK
jgi:hypothetical protein